MQFVTMLTADKRVGPRDLGGSVPCDDVKLIVDAINQMDGLVRTQVILEGDGKALLIGGGNDHRFNVILAVNTDEAFFTLANPSAAADEEVKIVTGGQAGLFPARHSLDRQTVLKAARYFFESGEMAQDLVWDRQ